jgi:cytochrome c oxidase subunit 2
MESRRRFQDWHHMLAMCAVMVAIAAGLVYVFMRVDLIPNPASMERGVIDSFIKLLLAIGGIFFAIIITVFGYALLFFRAVPGDTTDARPIRGNVFLELTWTIIPLVIVVVLSVYGGRVLDTITAVNPDYRGAESIYSLGAFVPGRISASDSIQRDMPVNVIAKRFIWMFGYPDRGIDSTYELVVPVNRRIVFRMRSEDVIHSFWVQEWGPKQDAVPGLSPVLRITPADTGRYTVICSQLCGYGHTEMTAPVKVVTPEEFEEWAQKQRAPSARAGPPPKTHVMIDLVAKNIAFDKKTITVPGGVTVMIDFHNEDKGIPHNFSVYANSEAEKSIFVGRIITGPSRITYTFTAPKTPGDYFFRCDVHPQIMTGTPVA